MHPINFHNSFFKEFHTTHVLPYPFSYLFLSSTSSFVIPNCPSRYPVHRFIGCFKHRYPYIPSLTLHPNFLEKCIIVSTFYDFSIIFFLTNNNILHTCPTKLTPFQMWNLHLKLFNFPNQFMNIHLFLDIILYHTPLFILPII